MGGFREQLKIQRWDDHRYYHHSRVNQSLHLVSAVSFVCAYATALKDPAGASLIGWLVAMTSRQVGHFFFEPKDYDVLNQATHQYKEAIKVGYNLRRKVILMTLWILLPLLLLLDPTLLGTVAPHKGLGGFIRHVGYLWLFLGVGALLFRTAHLFFISGPQSGLVWATKILTDPFHDIKLYYRAPAYLLRGASQSARHRPKATGTDIEQCCGTRRQ
ncbi:MAG: hypothetical protein JOY71_21575 [Acetobacteraceae bacterium]|nr:hypothetical protein [Acetobacteraceae bacterium]